MESFGCMKDGRENKKGQGVAEPHMRPIEESTVNFWLQELKASAYLYWGVSNEFSFFIVICSTMLSGQFGTGFIVPLHF